MRAYLVAPIMAMALVPALAQAQPDTHFQAGPPINMEDDPAFRKLSPEARKWVEDVSRRLDKAILQKDVAALTKLQLEVTRHDLLGKTICAGHVVDRETFVDALAISGPRNNQAIMARWIEEFNQEPGALLHTAIFTSDLRCVANDSTILDGRILERILPTSIGINKEGLVAYEAFYLNSAEKSLTEPRRGVFIENRWLYDLDPTKASLPDVPTEAGGEDFAWDDAGNRIIPKPGIVLVDTPAKTPQPDCMGKPKKHVFMPKPLQDQLGKMKIAIPALTPCPAGQK